MGPASQPLIRHLVMVKLSDNHQHHTEPERHQAAELPVHQHVSRISQSCFFHLLRLPSQRRTLAV